MAKFISFEGIECSGKGTQIKMLANFLRAKQQAVLVVREPGGPIYGEVLRAIIKHPEIALTAIQAAFQGHEDFPQNLNWSDDERTAEGELLMFMAARAEFVAKVVKPALDAEKIVIADRFIDSSRAYQGGGRFYHQAEKIKIIKDLNQFATGNLKPDLTFFLDISVEEMIKRRSQINDKDAFFEKTCDRDFFQRVREEYLAIRKEEPERFIVINGEADPLSVFHQINQRLNQ